MGKNPLPATVYLGLGSNLGDREQNLWRALELLSSRVVIKKVSSVYETEPVGYRDQPPFLNLVCQGTTWLTPEELLRCAKEIEAALGRKASFPNAARPIDIDILFYLNQVIQSPYLVVPHPHLEERAFVLIPLAEIAPEFVHPVSRKTIAELARQVGEKGCRKLDTKILPNSVMV